MQPYVLGVDIGTGSTKSIAVNANGEAFSAVKSAYPVNQPQTGFSEQDPEMIWLAFTDNIRTHVQKLQQPPVAICLSSVMHSIIPADKNGAALGSMMTWADARSENIAMRIRQSSSAEDLYRRTGTPLHAMSPLCKIIWLRENSPELFNNVCKFISIKEFIWFKLFNQFIVDISVASATGLLNIGSNKWDEAALQLAGITIENLSTPVSPGYFSTIPDSAISMLLNIPADVSFVVGASDGCLANLACNVTDQHHAAVTIGTSGAVRTTKKTPLYNFTEMTFNYKLDEETFICGGATNNGGNVLNWLLTNLFAKTDITHLDYTALFLEVDTIEPGANGLLFLPYLNGERAPHWDAKSCGTFFGIRQRHTKHHFARSVIEGVCFAVNDILQTLQKNGQEITQLHVSGGFVTSISWMQILADITGKKVLLFHEEDASAIGAAYLALKTIGLAENYNPLLSHTNIQTIEPDLDNHVFYKSYFNIFRSLYPVLKDSMHHLHNLTNK